MFIQQVRRSDDGFEVTIPAAEAERLGLHAGQTVSVSITPVERTMGLRPEIQEAFDRLWPEIEPGLRYLKDR